MTSSLRLDVSETFRNTGGQGLVVGPQKTIRLVAKVSAEQVPEGTLILDWDPPHAAELLEGDLRTPLPTGTYDSVFTWRFRPLVPQGTVTFHFLVPGALPQAAAIPVTIRGQRP